jgi:hypothetical protein
VLYPLSYERWAPANQSPDNAPDYRTWLIEGQARNRQQQYQTSKTFANQ